MTYVDMQTGDISSALEHNHDFKIVGPMDVLQRNFVGAQTLYVQ